MQLQIALSDELSWVWWQNGAWEHPLLSLTFLLQLGLCCLQGQTW